MTDNSSTMAITRWFNSVYEQGSDWLGMKAGEGGEKGAKYLGSSV